jgi:sugar lactone lactonase YvrE
MRRHLLLTSLALAVGCSGPAPTGPANDLATPRDMSVGNVSDLSMAVHDLVLPDLALPDLNVVVAMPDLLMPDLRMPDLLMPDLATPDLLMPDLLPPRDLTPLEDTTPPPDLAPAQVPPVVHQIAGVMVATLAGSAQAGAMDGTGAAAQFQNPVGIALDSHGLVYVTEYDGNRIRTVDSSGVTNTLTTGSANGFAFPFAITVASATQLLVQTDSDTTGAKTPTSGTLWRVDITSGVPTAAVTGLGRPRGLAFVNATTVAVSDRVRETVSTLASTGSSLTLLAGSTGNAGYLDATGAAARFDQPYGLALLPDGSVVVADTSNNRVRQVTASGVVTTFAGGPQFGNVDGTRAESRFNTLRALAADSAGQVFVSDNGDHRIRRIAVDGTVETVAGDGNQGFQNGTGAQAEFYGQEGIAVTPDGKTVYVADGNAGDGSAFHRIRVITIP